VQRFIGLYDERVRVFDAWGVWQYEGAQQWQRAVEGWFSSLGSERVRVTFEGTTAVGTTALAFASATVTYAGVSAEGEALRSMQNRISWGLRSSGHVLRIVHEHTSAPVGFDDMKAILNRAASK
jgi:ketosteroid isomerase-like protein